MSEPTRPVDVALRELEQSDAVVLIIGFKAGSLIPEQPRLTYTCAKYARACELRKPVFAFIKTDGGQRVNKEEDLQLRKLWISFCNWSEPGPAHQRISEMPTNCEQKSRWLSEIGNRYLLLCMSITRALGQFTVGFGHGLEDIREPEAGQVGLRQEFPGCLPDVVELEGGIGVRQPLANKRAAATLGLQESLSFEFVIRLLDGQGRDDQLLAQVPVRHELVSALEPTPGYGFGNLAHDLAVDRKLVGGIDYELHLCYI